MDKNNLMQWTLVHSPALSSQINGMPTGLSNSEDDLHLSLHGSHDSDSDSLIQEIKYQSELQHWISENEEHVHQETQQKGHMNKNLDTAEAKESNGDSTKVLKSGKEGLYRLQQMESNQGRYHNVDKYADLRYNPNWKRKPTENSGPQDGQEGFFLSSDEETLNLEESNNGPKRHEFQIYPGKKTDRNVDRDQPRLASEISDSASSGSSKSLLNERLNVASNKYFSLHENGMEWKKLPGDNKEDVSIRNGFFLSQSDDSIDQSSVGSGDKQQNGAGVGMNQDTKKNKQKQVMDHVLPRKDFIEKNKLTLGMPESKQDSYLRLLNKTKCDVDHVEVENNANVCDEAPTLIVTEEEQLDLGPEDIWHHRAQKLKKRKIKDLESSQKKVKNVSEEKASKHRNAQHVTGRQKELANVKDTKALGPNVITPSKPPVHQKPDWEENENSVLYYSLNTMDSSIKNSGRTEPFRTAVKVLPQINMSDLKTKKQFSVKMISPEQDPVMLSEMHIKDISHEYEQLTGKPLYNYVEPNSTHIYSPSHLVHDHNQIYPIYQSGDQNTVKYLNHPQDHKMVPEMKIYSKSAENSSFIKNTVPATHLLRFQHVHNLYPNPVLPPILPRVESDTMLNAEWGASQQATLTRSNSEGYLLQLQKQKQLQEKNSKVPRLKGFRNPDIKLGGLGPDYQGIKNKMEYLKQQKEYANKVKEINKKNVSKAPKKPPLQQESTSSVSRNKAMEYAKKIPKPKPVTSVKSPEQGPKEDRALVHMNIQPQMTLLEELQLRHEQEKQAVAAFKALHIV
ncbi:jhy protein homolog [Lissotriton helveticus]